MARVLVTPTIAVSPAGGGAASFETIGSGSLPLPTDPETVTAGAFRNYRYTATPAQGFTFAGFRVTVSYDDMGQPVTRTTVHAGTGSGGVWTYDAVADASWGDRITTAGFSLWWRYEWAAAGYAYESAITAISVVAEFVPVRVPTHMLVNSSNIESPAHLVYDPATGLLVADY